MSASLKKIAKASDRSRAEEIGAKVMANLALGRAIIREINAERRQQAEFHRRIIADLVLLDQQAGRPSWGLAGRISRKMGGRLSRRQVQKYLVLLGK